jgi:carboxylesterase type B
LVVQRETTDAQPPPPMKTNAQLFWHMMTDFVFQCPVQRVIKHWTAKTANDSRLFHYAFHFVPDYLNAIGGMCASDHVCHAVELPYVFHSSIQLVSCALIVS